MRAPDLFCGAGGASSGLARAVLLFDWQVSLLTPGTQLLLWLEHTDHLADPDATATRLERAGLLDREWRATEHGVRAYREANSR